MAPTITRVETYEFTHPVEGVAANVTGPLVHKPGNTFERHEFAIRIHTDEGITGEFVGGTKPGFAQIDMVADYLVGKNPLEREKHWNELKRALRSYDRMGIGPIDIALWDLAGKRQDSPIHELLGTFRKRLPAYASTYFGDSEGGLDSPEAYADFAEQCRDAGFPAYKIHPVEGGDAQLDAEIVRAVGERVGDEMRLMVDPVSGYMTWGDALDVGKACDEYDYFWYEDAYRDTGVSQHGHRRLRERIDTPLLQAELLRGVEAHTDYIDSEATDYIRADPVWDGGITGAMKIARIAEGHGIDVEYHLAGPHTRHCMAATRNSNYYELGLIHPESPLPHSESPVYEEYTDSVDSLADDGTVGVPDDPGLGVTYDWDYVEDNAVEHNVYE